MILFCPFVLNSHSDSIFLKHSLHQYREIILYKLINYLGFLLFSLEFCKKGNHKSRKNILKSLKLKQKWSN